MSLDACAEAVAKGDPDRFAAAMAAPVAARRRLLPLYAFNLEIARAPWVTQEPLIAEMRLQWWRDALAEAETGKIRRHEVVQPLAEVMEEAGLGAEDFAPIIDARRWDVSGEGFADMAALEAHLQAGIGTLTWLSARALGAKSALEPAVRAAGLGFASAAWLEALPQLRAAGRDPLPAALGPEGLARRGLSALREARAARMGAAVPALRAGWRAPGILARAEADPAAAEEGRLAEPEVRRRGRLAWLGLTGRW
ncbi:squalene/phytoene synthase family protein [Pseudoroseicyclus aestuarii]|uniref:Squalene/phytoene synthase n=1 Tax=Pseudoroseicyclus aestuarii TaxID=1795041 RepID=A0A318SX55_9RHOB|nr:squalene/phytoene synthase family protein [Pseudoroseicyclus aestuarii]PYE86053.1 squalene/phytoene synthase [Pseudoroseicyclus aestuarii]